MAVLGRIDDIYNRNAKVLSVWFYRRNFGNKSWKNHEGMSDSIPNRFLNSILGRLLSKISAQMREFQNKRTQVEFKTWLM